MAALIAFVVLGNLAISSSVTTSECCRRGDVNSALAVHAVQHAPDVPSDGDSCPLGRDCPPLNCPCCHRAGPIMTPAIADALSITQCVHVRPQRPGILVDRFGEPPLLRPPIG